MYKIKSIFLKFTITLDYINISKNCALTKVDNDFEIIDTKCKN